MQKAPSCLGCRTFFQQNETLPLQCMTVQYKNFDIPFKQNKHKWTILKTIVSFLNTKGGTIYVGIQDNNCKVVGKLLPSKARDQFKLYLLQLTQRIVPVIDLNHKEELSVQYIPVVKNKTFSGKYVTKIIVKQGDPIQTYCFVQKLIMNQDGRKDSDGEHIQIPHSFVRHNMGGARELKGLKLVEQSIKKAHDPPPKFNTFHQQCNPDPPEMEVQIKKIGFRGFPNRQSRRKFEKAVFKDQLQKLQVQHEIAYDPELKAVIIQLPTVDQFKRINNFIKSNLSSLNASQEDVRFADGGDYLGIHFYENTIKRQQESAVNQKVNQSPKKAQVQNSSNKTVNNNAVNKKSQPKRQQKKQKIKQANTQAQYYVQQSQQDNQSRYCLTLTHINPNLKDKLINYLSLSISKKINVQFQQYENTIQVIFQTKQDMIKYTTVCYQNSHLKALQNFGFNKQIRLGFNTGHLHILNFDKDKVKKMVIHIRALMKDDLKQVQILKKGNRHIIDCKMKMKSGACQWLDNLLITKPLRQFGIPGAHKGAAPKMKIFIHCDQPKI